MMPLTAPAQYRRARAGSSTVHTCVVTSRAPRHARETLHGKRESRGTRAESRAPEREAGGAARQECARGRAGPARGATRCSAKRSAAERRERRIVERGRQTAPPAAPPSRRFTSAEASRVLISTIMGTPGNARATLSSVGIADPLPAERKGGAAVPREAVTGVEALQFSKRPRIHRAGAVRRALERRVVDHDRAAVARNTHVELDRVGANRHPAFKRFERVLGGKRGVAAVRDHELFVRVEQEVHDATKSTADGGRRTAGGTLDGGRQ